MRDAGRDLAILRSNVTHPEPVIHGDFRRPRVGELVVAVGNPLGFTGALSTGVVHAIGSFPGMGGQDFIHTTARLAPGNSGGPLADADGKVIGINTAVAAGGLGLAVPASAVDRLLALESPPELGVNVRPIRIPGPYRGIALLVLGIVPGSPAEYASLRAGDLIVGANGKGFASINDLRNALDNASARPVTIQFLRGGNAGKREVTIRAVQRAAA
jgi:serine protease Do